MMRYIKNLLILFAFNLLFLSNVFAIGVNKIEILTNQQADEGIFTEINTNLGLGDSAYEKGNYDEAMAYYEKMKNLIPPYEYLLWAYYYNRVGRVYLAYKDTSKAIEYFVTADNHYKKEFNTPLGKDKTSIIIAQADNLLDLSIAHRLHGDLNIAMDKVEDAILLYKSYGDNEGLAKAITAKGNIYYIMEEFEAAEKLYYEAMEIYEGEGNFISVGRLYNNIAAIYVIRNDYEVAIELYFTSVKYKEDSGDYWGLALTYRNIAVLYEAMDDLRSAYGTMLKCIEIAEKYNDPLLKDYVKYLEFIKLRLE